MLIALILFFRLLIMLLAYYRIPSFSSSSPLRLVLRVNFLFVPLVAMSSSCRAKTFCSAFPPREAVPALRYTVRKINEI